MDPPDRSLTDMDSGGGEAKKGANEWPKFRDLGGIRTVLDELKTLLVPLVYPEISRSLDRKECSILLSGPSGCGKTTLAHAIAKETGIPFYEVSCAALVCGSSKENIQDLFSKAEKTARCIVFVDNVEAISSELENHQNWLERGILSQLKTCMDHILGMGKTSDGYILVILATNRPGDLDPQLRRSLRFDWEITLDFPDERGREDILSVLTRGIELEGSVDLAKIARSAQGFVGAELGALVGNAGKIAIKRSYEKVFGPSEESTKGEQNDGSSRNECSTADMDKSKIRMADLQRASLDEDWWRQNCEELGKCSIRMADFEAAVNEFQPFLKRGVFSSIPDVKWEDIGGLDKLREEFDRYIIMPIKYPEIHGLDLATSILLYGPTGCGKTLIVKAAANEAGANFIHIRGFYNLNDDIGNSESAVRTIFSRARIFSPCIIFFDEFDYLAAEHRVSESVRGQLLIELDHATQQKDVSVIAATNRAYLIDPAFIKRFEKLFYVPLPNEDERGLILTTLAKNKTLDDGIDLISFGRGGDCANLSGADLSQLMDEAEMAALVEKSGTIKAIHFGLALRKIRRDNKQIELYNDFSKTSRPA